MLGNWEDRDMTGLLPSQAQRIEFKCVSAHWHHEHCRAHVLQLCCISAARCLPSLKKVFATLMSVWKMFHCSPKKFSALKEMQALINHPQLKMIKPSDTCWLAHDRSVKAIRCSMRPLIDTLEHIHEDLESQKHLVCWGLWRHTTLWWSWWC